MYNWLKNRPKLIMSAGLLAFISGCTRVIDGNGNVLPEKIISTTTQLSQILADESWFSAFFVFPLAQVINFLTPVIGVALAIVVVTVAIKALTFGFTVKSTVASQKMQVLQPEMTAIQKKYEGKKDEQSRMKQAQEMQALYTKHKINPFGTILVAFIQFPVIIAMWQAVQRSEAVLNGVLLGAELNVTPLTGILAGQWLYLVIYVLMGLFQIGSMLLPAYLAKRTAIKSGKKAPANSQQGMMIGMFVFIMFISINWPTAMSLYWLVSSAAQVAQTLFIQHNYIDKPVAGV
ncbi:MAG: YidC/Oxa1 family membrane protein insertase [Erysipelotrichaceae bacterium]|nr:YidC/Oxa1 family membrane protein insertase [Erysipelotrichaceae bacterium]